VSRFSKVRVRVSVRISVRFSLSDRDKRVYR